MPDPVSIRHTLLTQDAPAIAPQLPSFFARYQADINDALRKELAPYRLPLYDTLRYYLGWMDEYGRASEPAEGKRLRPTLCLLACEAAGGDPADSLSAAVALEYVHNFSLIHDDIEDGDRIRHHRPTLWAVWGEPTAIVSGNALVTVADLAIQGSLARGVPEEAACMAAEALTDHYLRMMEGQYLDIDFEHRMDVSVDEYLDMIERKTGALITCSVYLGALVGSASRPEGALVGSLRRVGHELGRIFQIRDDVLGVWGGPETGKPVGADIERKKKSLPVVHALSHARGSAKRRLESTFAQPTLDGGDVEQVLEVMEDLRTRDYCQELADARWLKARSMIKSLPLAGDSAADFLELGEFLLVRES